MTFLQPWGLLALLALPVIAFLHLFRRRFEPREVSALFLWVEEHHTLESGRRPEPLRPTASLLCELLAAALLALLLAGPRGLWSDRAQHLVCVLDGAASMDARAGTPESVRDAALAVLRERLDRLGSGGRVSLIVSGARPRRLAGPGAFPHEARAALEDYRPVAGRHELGPALALGIELAAEGSVLLLTDRVPAEGLHPAVELVALGQPADNAALLEATRTRAVEDGGVRDRVLLTVGALSRGPLTRVLTLRTDELELARRELELEPDRRVHLGFDLPPGTGPVVASLGADALAIDDRAFLAPVPPRPLVLGSSLTLEELASLGLTRRGDPRPLARWLDLVPESTASGGGAQERAPDLVLTRDPSVAAGSGTWTLHLAAPPSAVTDPWTGPFLVDRVHPLLEGLSLEGVLWSEARAIDPPGRPLVSVSERVLLGEEVAPDGTRTFHLDLDPARSTLQRSPDWPILLANLAELRRGELPGPVKSNVVFGEAWLLRQAGDDGDARVLAPEGVRGEPTLAAIEGDLWVSDFPAPGLYRLERAGVEEPLAFGVSFADAEVSDLRACVSDARASEAETARAAAAATSLDALLATLALLALAADWWVLVRSRGTLRTRPAQASA